MAEMVTDAQAAEIARRAWMVSGEQDVLALLADRDALLALAELAADSERKHSQIWRVAIASRARVLLKEAGRGE